MCGEYFWGRVPKSLTIFGAILWRVDSLSLLTPYFRLFQWRLSACDRLAPRTAALSFNSPQNIHFSSLCFSLSLSLYTYLPLSLFHLVVLCLEDRHRTEVRYVAPPCPVAVGKATSYLAFLTLRTSRPLVLSLSPFLHWQVKLEGALRSGYGADGWEPMEAHTFIYSRYKL